MRSDVGEHKGSGDASITEGFTNWKKPDRFQVHVGSPNSSHNQAWRKWQALMKQNQLIDVAIRKQSQQVKEEYIIQLNAIVEAIQWDFLELFNFLASHNEAIHKVLKNTRENLKITAPKIQKDIVRAAASETTKVILDDLGDNVFAILIDESGDVSVKEQMVVALHYVDKKGQVIERLVGLVHVSNTNALSLKSALESLFEKYGLRLSRLRGQGYDDTSNMQGEFNGLRSLLPKENNSAFHIHCFAYQLQLAFVTVAKKHVEIALFFTTVANLSNVVGASSCKHRDILHESQIAKVKKALQKGEISSGRGLNEESREY